MAHEHIIFLSVPGLRKKDIDAQRAPTLHAWASQGVLGELIPTFPCVTSPVQASMLTGLGPQQHGIIANGFYHRDKREVAFWVAHHDVVGHPCIWDDLKRSRRGYTSAVWHAQNIKGAGADFIVTPSPIHHPDGRLELWCYSKPDGLYSEWTADLGHFPLQHYWGPLSNIESTRWILAGAAKLVEQHAPNFHYVYIPHLDYAAQKFGPDSPQALKAVAELDECLAAFAGRVARTGIGANVVYLVAGEYALTDVTGVIAPNRLLRDAGMLHVRQADDGEHLDLSSSRAFAMVDHQLAHLYLTDPSDASDAHFLTDIARLFEQVPGIAGVYAGDARAEIGMNHPRSGEVILIAEPSHWFAYYWWIQNEAAPAFARTVDIHAKPGYDPVELFFDPATRGIPLDPSLVLGSHGAPAQWPAQRAALLCSAKHPALETGALHRDTDVKSIVLRMFGV